MIVKSAKIYLFGFITGTAICFALIHTFPQVYLAFINLLIRKIEVQMEFGEGLHLNIPAVIILNNVSASLIMSYGGAVLSKIRMVVGGSTVRSYYLLLHTFPVVILFLNGFVLGAFLIPYLTYFHERVLWFLSRLLPHGVFEIPGIIISGSIGLRIAELGKLESVAELKNRMNKTALSTWRAYILAVFLLVIGGIIEGSSI